MGPAPGTGNGRAGAHANTPLMRAATAAGASRSSKTGRNAFRTALELEQLVGDALTLVCVLRACFAIAIDPDGIVIASEFDVSVGEMLVDDGISAGELGGTLELAN